MFGILKVLKRKFKQDRQKSPFISEGSSARMILYPGMSKCEPSVDVFSGGMTQLYR